MQVKPGNADILSAPYECREGRPRPPRWAPSPPCYGMDRLLWVEKSAFSGIMPIWSGPRTTGCPNPAIPEADSMGGGRSGGGDVQPGWVVFGSGSGRWKRLPVAVGL